MRATLLVSIGMLVAAQAAAVDCPPRTSPPGTPHCGAGVRCALSGVAVPDEAGIRSIPEKPMWPNPWVVARGDGFELVVHGRGREVLRAANLAQLQQQLLALPADRWPLGAVVAGQSGVRGEGPGGPHSRKALADLDALSHWLAQRCIRYDGWPAG